jgi:hypothetical protein
MSNKSAYYADTKYISFIKFSGTHRRLQVWENLPYFWEMEKHTLKVEES